jgi:hypothetical protein
MRDPVDKYLGRWAEPEHRIAARVAARFPAAIVVPATDEPADFLRGLAGAAGALVILVVNARDDAPARTHRANAELLARVTAGAERISSSPPAFVGRAGGIELLVVDRSSPGYRLPPKQGVGLARKIGTDLALGLVAAGRLDSPFIGSTDADVDLPGDYVEALVAAPRDAVALVFSFVHVPSGDAALDRATTLYERWLHHYVNGLALAGSAFAFHTVGSALAVNARAYAAVRGFPRRLAAEDFHLLDKLARLGRVSPARSAPIRIRARRSERVPFGTGPAVARIEAGEPPPFYRERSFELLGVWLRALDAFAEHRDPERLRADVSAHRPLAHALEALGAIEAAISETSQAPDARRLAHRLRGSFGALPTLRLVRALDRSLA